MKHIGKPTKSNILQFNKTFSIPGFLKEYNEPLLELSLKDSSYKLSLNIQWSSGKIKMRDFFSLNYSLRRTALMSMIIIMSRFGPTIIDAPEVHFDNEDIANFLVPIIKKYKDFQQVIIFTNNPLLAINTDPDNYILLEMQGVKFKELIQGFSIDDDEQKSMLLSIMEGSIHSFHRRADRYSSGV